jgi:TonB-dependent receptor
VTVVGGRFVYVRGLGERYSTTLLNGSTLPSPDPERRVVPLDLFPAGVISSLTVQKTFSPDLPGEFGGGVVMIKTRDIPEETQAHLSISTGYRSATTFRTATGYEGGATDFLGFGLPERRLAQEIRDVAGEAIIQPADSIFDPTSGVPADQLERLGEQLDLRFPLRDVTVAPPFGITGDVGGKLALGRDVKVGGALGASYGQSWFLEDGRRETYQWGDAPDQQNRLDVLQLQRQVDLSAILNLGLDVGEHHQVRYTGFLSRLSSDETADVSGFSAERNSDIRITRLRWVEQMLFDNQLRGTHALLDEHLQVDWRYVVSVATRDEPNRRQAQYNYEERGEVWTLDPDNYQRFDSELFDTNHDGGLDLTVPLQLFGGVETKVKVGGAAEYKKRNVKTRRYTFDEATSNAAIVRFMKTRPIEHLFEDDTIAPDRWQLEEVTLPSDNYDGEQTLVAGYGMVDLGILANLRVLVGARVELFRLKVGTRNPIAAPGSGEVSTDLDALDVMPGVTATWSFREDMQLRLAASRTVNRPNFREVSPAQFRDVAKSLINEGNPDLENARITHLDLRWEWYPDAGESVSLAVFAKLFEDPIELTAQPSSNLIFVPDNVEAARNIGVELEFRKGFGFLWEALEDLYAAGNLSVVTSRVDVGDKGGVLTETQRPLQGQSPYALNLQVGYENVDWGTTASVLFNVFGRRIDKVGALGQPSIYEEPVPTLDLVVGQRVAERVKLSFKWQNILDPAVRFSQTQASSGESRDFYRYRRGFTVGVGASISLE